MFGRKNNMIPEPPQQQSQAPLIVTHRVEQPPRENLNKFKTLKDIEFRRKLQKNLKNRFSSAQLPRFSVDSGFRPEYFLLRKV